MDIVPAKKAPSQATKPPEVSIITANYNCEAFVAATINSVLNQTFTNWELIIVDDCSSDNSVHIIEKYCSEDERIIFMRNDYNSGPAATRNKAIKASSGRFIAFLDSDDLWAENKLELQVQKMKDEGLSLTYTEYYKIDEEGRIISEKISRPSKVSYKKMLRSNFIPCLTAMYDTNYLGKVYMPDILMRQDYGLWLEILKKVDYAFAINEPLAYYRIRTRSSISSNKYRSALFHWKILREIEHISLPLSLAYFVSYAILGYIKFRK